MIRTSVLSDEISQDLGIAVEAAREFGCSGLEIRSVGGVPPHRLTDEDLRDVRRTLDAGGLAASAFCPPALKCPPPSTTEEVRTVTEVVQRAVEQAVLLGTRVVRIFSFYRDGATPQPAQAAVTARRVLGAVELPPGVRLVLETGTRSNTPTVGSAVEFLTALDDDRIGILWDPGNTVFSGFDPHPFPGDFEQAPERVEHVHVKDPAGTRRYVRLGDGDLPWPDIIDRLDAMGYSGWLTLETHWRHDRELTPQERDEPWGPGISEGGRSATAECMRALNAWLGPGR